MVNKKKLIILSSVLLLVSIVACLLLYSLNSQLKNRQANPSGKSGNSQVVAVTDRPFYIELVSNLSTGYQWQADFDTTILKLNDIKFSQSTDTENVGKGEIQTFEFQVVKKKDTSITFEYLRPWEVGTPPAKTRDFDITIR